MATRRTKNQVKEIKQDIVKLAETGNFKGTEIAKLVGVDPRYVSRVLKEFKVDMSEVTAFQAVEESILANAGKKYLARLQDPALIKKTNARDAAVIYGILKDKSARKQVDIPTGNLAAMVVKVNNLYMDRSGIVAPDTPADCNIVEIQAEPDHKHLPVQQEVGPPSSCMDPQEQEAGSPDPGGAGGGIPAPRSARIYIPPLSDAPKTKRGRKPRKQKE